jgi:hypothetical protein
MLMSQAYIESIFRTNVTNEVVGCVRRDSLQSRTAKQSASVTADIIASYRSVHQMKLGFQEENKPNTCIVIRVRGLRSRHRCMTSKSCGFAISGKDTVCVLSVMACIF